MSRHEFIDDRLLLNLSRSENANHLAQTTFSLIRSQIPCDYMTAMFRPLEFELPIILDEETSGFRWVADEYLKWGWQEDIWLQRSKPTSTGTVIRHTDHTPLETYLVSPFYKKLLTHLDIYYSLMITVWERDTCLAWLGMWRTSKGKDFSDNEVSFAKRIHPHIEIATERVARRGDEETRIHTLIRFIDGLPKGTILASWELNVIHMNPRAREICVNWEQRRIVYQGQKTQTLPPALKTELNRLKSTLADSRPNDPETPRYYQFNIEEDTQQWEVQVQFLASKTLSASRGSFLIHLESLSAPKLSGHSNVLQNLSPVEREVAKRAAYGLTNEQISEELGKSFSTVKNQMHHILKKTGMKNRSGLARAFHHVRDDDQ